MCIHAQNFFRYAYYIGRKALFDADYGSAKENLTFALTHCHKESTKNKRLILTYLIPVNLLRGRLPATELLEKYDLMQFADISTVSLEAPFRARGCQIPIGDGDRVGVRGGH